MRAVDIMAWLCLAAAIVAFVVQLHRTRGTQSAERNLIPSVAVAWAASLWLIFSDT